jgi:hypothetical protein
MSLPIISITDHALTEYTHNIVVRFTAFNHHVDYCTHINDTTFIDAAQMLTRLESTLSILGAAKTVYTFTTIRWTDDI